MNAAPIPQSHQPPLPWPGSTGRQGFPRQTAWEGPPCHCTCIFTPRTLSTVREDKLVPSCSAPLPEAQHTHTSGSPGAERGKDALTTGTDFVSSSPNPTQPGLTHTRHAPRCFNRRGDAAACRDHPFHSLRAGQRRFPMSSRSGHGCHVNPTLK